MEKSSNTELVIRCHNVHGLVNNNQEYLNVSIILSNVLFISETMLTTHLALENRVGINNKKIFSKPAKKGTSGGRPAGGLAFIVDDDLICNVLFLKSSVAAIAINNLVIIGVYLVYRDGSKNIEQFENELSIINETVKKYEDLS